MLHEAKQLDAVELPRSLQIEPVGRRAMSRRVTPVLLRVDGARNAPPAFLSFDAFRRILDEMPGLEELRLQGDGEPLAHPRFFDMVRYAAGRGIRVSTTSRLQLFSRHRAEECVASGLAQLNVPLDAAGTRAYDFSRSGARFERLLRHLRALAEVRRARRSLWPRVSLVAVVMRRNIDELAGVVRLAHEHGADSVAFQRLQDFVDVEGIPPGHRRIRKFVEAEALAAGDAERTARAFEQAAAAGRELNVGLQFPAEAPAGACPWPWHASYVTFAGEARPCALASRAPGTTLGNVLKEGVAAVWNADAYRDFRAGHVSGELPALCRGCSRAHPA